jgi:hypothetical protein
VGAQVSDRSPAAGSAATFLVSDESDLVCIDCDQPLPPGAPYGERLTGSTGDGTPVVELACVYCAMGVK